MIPETSLNFPYENNSSSLPSAIEFDMDSQSCGPLTNAVTEEKESLSEPSIPSCMDLNRKGLSILDGEKSLLVIVQVPDDVIINSLTTGSKQSSKLSPFNNNCLTGKSHLQIVNNQANNVQDTWLTRWVTVPNAYLWLEADGETWLGDIRELRMKLFKQGYPYWHRSMMEFLWTLDLIYRSIAARIGMVFKG